MSDAEIVQAIVAGEPSGLAEAYRHYADRLYDYCARTLDDRDAAADAVHDTFLIAQERAAQLRDPDALRPWLYAIARSRCLHLLRDRRRLSTLDEVADVHDDTVESPESEPHREELRVLVRSALAGLNPREREIIDLNLRHELSGPELAAALGVPVKQAHAVASTARTQLESAIGTVVLARTRGRECDSLRSLLAEWDGELTPLWRKRINRHTKSCETCSEQRRRLVTPAALLGAAPILIAPPSLYTAVLSDAADPALVAHRIELAQSTGPYRDDGFPRSQSAPGTPSPVATLTKTVLAAVAVLALLSLSGASDQLSAASPELLAGGAGPADSPEHGEPVDLTDPGPGNGTPASPGSTAPGPEASDEVGEGALLWVEGVDATEPGCASVWVLAVSAGTGVEMGSGVLSVEWGQSARIAMDPSGSGVWQASVEGLPVDQSVAWSVALTDTRGVTHVSETHTLTRPSCPESPTTPDEDPQSGGGKDDPPPADPSPEGGEDPQSEGGQGEPADLFLEVDED